MVELKNIILNTPTETLEKVIAPFIEEQFPSFMRRDYRKLVMFIKAYYEWMDKQGNPGFVISNLSSVYDVDKSLEEYYSHFKNTYLEGFPDVLATNTSGRKPNKNTLLKHIRDFYGNKGTENAYKFLFRVLYDSDVEFYYPKEDILKTSDGRWIEKVSIKTTSSNGSVLFSAKGQTVYQYNGNELLASAEVDTVVQYNQNGYEITEFFLNNLIGNFVSSLPVTFEINAQQYQETVFSVLSDFFIQTPGSDFRVGDEIYITDAKGTGFSAFIEQTGLGGSIKKIGVKNSGINYFNTVTVSFISQTGNLSSAVVFARPTAVTRYPGFYSNNSGKLSSTKKIQDGHYYQDFSYELKSAVSLDTYFSVLKDLIHPAGMRMFGSILVQDSLENFANTSAQGTFFRDPIIGNYTPYTSGTTLDLRANGRTGGGGWCGAEGDLYPLGYNPYIGSTSEVGPSGKTAPLGTLFYGTSLGYTYCIVPEDGKTAHDPLGAPLGSTTAWFNGKETALTPQGMRGLVLWLKPENIGVCGAVANGASVDVWRDASPSQNDAVPPTWDKWNGVSKITQTSKASPSQWDKEARTTNYVTKIVFVPDGLCGGFTMGRHFMMGLNTDPSSSSGYSTLDYAWYASGSYSNLNFPRASEIYESGVRVPTLSGSYDFGTHTDSTVFSVEYQEPNVVYALDGVEKRRVYAGYGLTFYMDSSFYSDAIAGVTGTSVTVLETSYRGTPVVPQLVVSSGITQTTYAGLTVDKLRPTLAINDGGIAGATGVSFGGGLLIGPKTSLANSTTTNIIPRTDFSSGWSITTQTITLLTGITATTAPGRLDSRGVVGVKVSADTRPSTASLWNRKFFQYTLPSTYRVADKVWTTSVYAKAGSGSYPYLRILDNGALDGGTTPILVVNLSNGSYTTAYTSSVSYKGHSVIPVGDGWYRISLVIKANGTSNGYTVGSRIFYMSVTDSSGNEGGGVGGWSGSGNTEMYLWGPQFEEGTYAKPFVETTGAPASSTANTTIDYLDSRVTLPFTPGGTFESMLEGQHMYLTKPLILPKEADAFLVFRVKAENSGVNTGFISSSKPLWDGTFFPNDDTVIHCRGWNSIDQNNANLISGNYAITGNTVRYYYNTASLSFRPWGGSVPSTVSTAQRGIIGYDPHVSNLATGRVIGEVGRDSTNTLFAYYNGDRATNYSPSTGRSVAVYSNNSLSESPTPVSGITVDIGRIGAYMSSGLSAGYAFGTTAWVSGITAYWGSNSNSFNGVLNEVIVFDRKLQEEERQQIYGYLARKYKMDTALPDSYYLAHASGYEKGLTYWSIAHHPNSKDLLTIPAGVSFAGITITNFLNMPETIYKSKGTVLSGGTVLAGDTYDYLENTGA